MAAVFSLGRRGAFRFAAPRPRSINRTPPKIGPRHRVHARWSRFLERVPDQTRRRPHAKLGKMGRGGRVSRKITPHPEIATEFRKLAMPFRGWRGATNGTGAQQGEREIGGRGATCLRQAPDIFPTWPGGSATSFDPDHARQHPGGHSNTCGGHHAVPRNTDVTLSAIYKCHWGRARGGRARNLG